MKSLITLSLLFAGTALAGPPPPRAPVRAHKRQAPKKTKLVKTDPLFATGKGPYSKPGGVRRDHRVPRGEIVFEVPIKLQRMHRAIKKVRAWCMLMNYVHTVIGNGGSAERPVVNGWFKGNLKVAPKKFRAHQRVSPSRYRCELQVYADGKWFRPNPRHKRYPSDPDEPLKFANEGRL